MYILDKLNIKKVAELKEIAKELNISKYEKLKKQDLVYAILDKQAEEQSYQKKESANKKEFRHSFQKNKDYKKKMKHKVR